MIPSTAQAVKSRTTLSACWPDRHIELIQLAELAGRTLTQYYAPRRPVSTNPNTNPKDLCDHSRTTFRVSDGVYSAIHLNKQSGGDGVGVSDLQGETVDPESGHRHTISLAFARPARPHRGWQTHRSADRGSCSLPWTNRRTRNYDSLEGGLPPSNSPLRRSGLRGSAAQPLSCSEVHPPGATSTHRKPMR